MSRPNRLSSISTNTDAYYDNQSLRTLDQIPTAKPSITYLDKLWTQIDVLDDVKLMSQQVKEKGSFFNDQFTSDLNQLKQLQEKLIEVMAAEKFTNNDNFKRQSEKYKSTMIDNDSRPGSKVPTVKGDKMNNNKFKEFERNDNSVYKKQNFDDINRYVNDVKGHLDKVGQSMKKFEDTTRDLW